MLCGTLAWLDFRKIKQINEADSWSKCLENGSYHLSLLRVYIAQLYIQDPEKSY
jgi:hypothetical protein